jgi:hypothetical protein
MTKRHRVATAVFIATAMSWIAAVAASPAAPAPRFQQPLLVPDAVWSFDVELDLLRPANTGTTLHGSFALTAQAGDQIQVTWTMANERQVLAADIFANKIVTVSIADSSASVDLALTPPLVHFAYPLSVGESWADQSDFTGVLGGHPLSGLVTSTFQVAREELVTTPAGTFDALVLVNDMAFPALGQQLQATLWVTSDGILVRRESRINGVLVQAIALSGVEVPVSSMIQQLLLELGLLHDELSREHRDDALVELGVRLVEHSLQRALAHPTHRDLAAARALIDLVAARLKVIGAPDSAPSLTATGVIRNQISLTFAQLTQSAP